jgi:hypothetical protein
MEQPNPIPNTSTPIVDLVMEDMKERKRLGIERYGTPLQANNGRDALRDAYEEALDLAIYLRQAIEERPKPAPQLEPFAKGTIVQIVKSSVYPEYNGRFGRIAEYYANSPDKHYMIKFNETYCYCTADEFIKVGY